MKLLTYGILLIIFLSVILWGGAVQWVPPLLNLAVLLLFIIYYILRFRLKKKIRIHYLGLLLILFLALLIFQQINLPQKIAAFLYPETTGIKEYFLKGFQSNYCLTFNLFNTSNCILSVITVFLLYLTAYNILSRKPGYIIIIYNGLIITGAVLCVYALFQYFFDLKFLLWKYRKYDAISGTFFSRNHFVSFILLILPLSLTGFIFNKNIFQFIFYMAASIIFFLCIALSGSRGGFYTSLITIFLFYLPLIKKFKLKHHVSKTSFVVMITSIILVIFLILASGLKDSGRYTDISKISQDDRIKLWKDCTRVIKKHIWFGTGWGSLNNIIKYYQKYNPLSNYSNAENEYIELLVETGITGTLIVFSIFIIIFYRILISVRRIKRKRDVHIKKTWFIAFSAGLTGILLQSLVDFSLKLPSNLLVFIVEITVIIVLLGVLNNKNKLPVFSISSRNIAVIITVLFLSVFVIYKNINQLAAYRNFIIFKSSLNNNLSRPEFDRYKEKVLNKDMYNTEYYHFIANLSKFKFPEISLKTIKTGLNYSPIEIKLYMLGSNIYSSLKDGGNRDFFLERMTNCYPVNPNSYFNAGNILIRADEDEKAVTNYRKCLQHSIDVELVADEFFGDYSEYYFGKILKILIMKNKSFDYIAKILPREDYYWYYRLGLSFMQLNNKDFFSLKSYLKSITYNNYFPPPFLLIPKLKINYKNIPDYFPADSKNKVIKLILTGIIYSKMNLWEQAKECFLKAYTLDKNILHTRNLPKYITRKEDFTGLLQPKYQSFTKILSLYEICKISNEFNLNIKYPAEKIGGTGVAAPFDIIAESCGSRFSSDKGFAYIIINGRNYSKNLRGYNIVTINPENSRIESKNFDTRKSSANSFEMNRYINNLEEGTIVIGAVKDDAGTSLTQEGVRALNRIGVKNSMKGKYYYSHAFIGVKGAPRGSALEDTGEKPVRLYVTKGN